MHDVTILHGDALDMLRTLPTGSVQCCVTSPPYWGLRDYGTATWSGGAPDCDHKPPAWINDPGDLLGAHPGQLDANAVKANRRNGHTCPRCDATRIDNQIGLEPTPAAYVARLVEVFAAVWRVLRDDGTLWLNLGDSYCSTDKWGGGKNGNHGKHTQTVDGEVPSWACRTRKPSTPGLKPKDLCMIPARVALALQDAGWYLRAEIIWAKKAPMPESVTDRPTRSHEQIFLLAKSARYFYDAEAVKETSVRGHAGSTFTAGKTGHNGNGRQSQAARSDTGTRNQRDVWTLGPEPYAGAHFATFPSEIPRRAILAGSKPGDTVLDPFCGSGTTLAVALALGRHGIGIELNAGYIELAERRIVAVQRPLSLSA